jgi:hypothetical protein
MTHTKVSSLSAKQLEKEYNKAEALYSIVCKKLIEAGRDAERYWDTFERAQKEGDPLSLEFMEVHKKRQPVVLEIKRRQVYRNIPHGFLPPLPANIRTEMA